MRLYRHCREHFEAEESFMKNNAYPSAQAHTASHNLMLDKLVEASRKIQHGDWRQNDTLTFMREWIQHVQNEDRAIGEYFRNKGQELEA
ncbi:hemerythrin family protein [Methylomonas sp. SURF-1]|uniref:Hemerythrin family protein n=1 Tax=Methylomonas aurea TaxID=2952224 RepID=A0ABT1UCF4_9GAMM|nr:hemerythrin family protein [Methylomonas sp. SURF-1]MCQ8179904.1 hemerythrin family protein [Methylomonas sp. SURF-1]